MTGGPIEPEPPRLGDEPGGAGNALRSAGAAFGKGLSEPAAWRRLAQRRQRRTAVMWGLGAVTIAIAVAVFAPRDRTERSQPLLRPEVAAPTSSASETLAGPPPEVTPVPTPTANPKIAPPQRALVAPPSLGSGRTHVENPTEANCRKLASSEKVGSAVDCFEALSRAENGLTAEVALYEAARLSAESLGDTQRGLRLLDEHRRRFSKSALRGEVEWLRVRSFHRAGHTDEALEASEALLADPAGRTLASELHFLRGQIFQDARRDCGRAVSEFVALVGNPGSLGDQAEFRRATCLEELGRRDDARAAYERYLKRSAPGRAAETRERLERLRSSASGSHE